MELDMDANYSHLNTWDECLHQLLKNKHFSDIIFVTEFDNDSVSFPAHKLILAMSSPRFAEMFYDPKAVSINHIILCNVQPKAVELMLSHIYFRREVQFESLDQCFCVLSLATSYELSILRRICVSYIEDFIDVEHVCAVYQIAISVRNRNLALKSFEFMQKEINNIFKQDSWRNTLPETVEAIVKQDYLNIDGEFKLFEAVLDWTKWRLGIHGMTGNAKRLRQGLEPLLPYFRFYNMGTGTFLKIAAETQIFTNDEIASIALNFVKRNSCQLPSWFNNSTNCRSYECRANVDNKYQSEWFNINKNVYSHSERVGQISTTFRAKSSDFAIKQLNIAICDDCLAHNSRSKRPNIIVKATVKVGTDVREKTVMLPMDYYIMYRQAPNYDKSEPLLLARSLKSNFISPKCVGMETHSPIVQAFLDPDSPKYSEVTKSCSSTLSEVIDLEPPVIVQSEERFTISLETINNDEPFFFCCKKKPSFEGVPFSTHTVVQKTEEASEIWCVFASVRYCMKKEEQVLYE